MARNILFDLDGTLLDSRPGIEAGLRRTVAQLGYSLPQDYGLNWAIGPPLTEVITRLLGEFNDARISEGLTLYRKWYGEVGLFDSHPYTGITSLLVRLQHSGRRLFVATSKRVDFARKVLDHFHLTPYFAAVHGTGLDGRHGTKAELIQHVLEENDLSASETLMVGDREQDITGARANHVRVVGALWGYGTPEELRHADHLCRRPDELLTLLREDGT